MKILRRLYHWLRTLVSSGNFQEREESGMNLPGTMWIDLSALDGEPQRCDVQLILTEQGTVDSFEAMLSGLSALTINRLLKEAPLIWGQAISGTIEDGRQFSGTIATITSFRLVGAGSLEIGGKLSNIAFANSQAALDSPQRWVFTLSNVQLSFGDAISQIPLPANAPAGAMAGWSRDSIEFQANGRQWRLTDTNSGKWKKLSRNDFAKPIFSGRLTTEWRTTDDDEDLTAVASDISDILSIALSRAVSWISYTLEGTSGKGMRSYERSAYAAAFAKHGSVPINNYDFGVLKAYLELTLPQVSANRIWFHRTLGLLLQSQIADMLDVKCSILYILVDRLSSHVVQKTGNAEIDAELKPRAKAPAFISELHEVLKKLSPSNWTNDHTNAVLTEIKRWNQEPSFVKKVQRACTTVDLPAPDKDLLKPRNELLHHGELDTGSNDTVAHYLELDWVVLALTLRILGYEGMYYHPKFGTDPVLMKAQLISKQSATADSK